MLRQPTPGDCVRLPDGRVGRARECGPDVCRVRVRRTTSVTHQLVEVPTSSLTPVPCPKGWMSPAGYERYLAVTLEKLRGRQERRRAGGSEPDRPTGAP